MGTYADSLLSEGETVVRRERQHWLSLLLDSRAAIALWIIAVLVLAAVVIPNIQGTGRTVLSTVALGALLIGLVIFLFRFWQWRTEEYLVTSRRLLKVSGIINKESGDSSLEKINDAVLFENLLGRMLNYGDLDILTAAEVAVDRYRMLNHAKAFKIDMLNAKHSLEHEVAYVEMPSPPIKTDGPAGGGDTPLPPAERPPAPPPAAAAAVAAADTVPVAAPTAPVATAAAVEPAAAIVADAPAPAVEAASESPVGVATEAEPEAAPDGAATDDTAATDDAASAPVATSAIDTPDEVMQALSRLADLRDNGTITADEYESKKQELLARL